jgi:hypothetical protein
MNDAKIPTEINNYQQYHPKCYQVFTALPPNHRKLLASNLSSASRYVINIFFDFLDIQGVPERSVQRLTRYARAQNKSVEPNLP